jgi:ABC-2 type transport system ATP-binding protein
MQPHAIDCQQVNKEYPHFKLTDINLQVKAGSVMGFVGPNGAGKSTTMRIIMGLIRADHGSVRVLGKSMPDQQIAAKQDIGFVSEDMRLYGSKSIGFHMDFIRAIYPGWDERLATSMLERFNLVREQKVKGLSHGQRVKASLLLVLARSPKLLILDEPTTGLDPVARQEIMAEMKKVLADEDRSILFSSHNTLDVEQISDHITFILDGRIIDSRDKVSFLNSWRRLSLQLPDTSSDIPEDMNLLDLQRDGSGAIAVTDNFSEQLVTRLKQHGTSVCNAESMSLEDIFLARVNSNREVTS